MTTFLVLLAAVLLLGYWISLRLHPYTACPTCEGRGRHHGALFNRSWRPPAGPAPDDREVRP
jgi:hypothetical protein